jgi:hypothetical protein
MRTCSSAARASFTRHPLLLVLTLGGSMLLTATLLAPPPQWWATRGAINNNPADDYAAANLGQLKHFASKAAQELALLPDPTGDGMDAVNAMVASWAAPASSGIARDDYAALNLGQLKAVAKPFYDRLIAVGYAAAYPWTSSTADDDNYAVANLGQLKHVFSFDLSRNSDGDTIPDWWESNHQFNPTQANNFNLDSDGDGVSDFNEFLAQTSPRDFYNGKAPFIRVISGSPQYGSPATAALRPMTVSIHRQDFSLMANAPVTFLTDGAGGKIKAAAGGTPLTTIELRTNEEGLATVYYTFPSLPNTTSTVSAKAGLTEVRLLGRSRDESGPSAPSNVLATRKNLPQLSAFITWNDNSANEGSFVITRSTDGVNYSRIARIPANTTTYTDFDVEIGGAYSYLVTSDHLTQD